MASGTKVLVIGASGFDSASELVRVECVSWDDLARLPNPRDFDFLLINLLPFKSEFPLDLWEILSEQLSVEATFQILRQGQIVVIGDATLQVGHPLPPPVNRMMYSPFLAWTGIKFEWDDGRGDTMRFDKVKHPAFERLAGALRRWDYSLKAVTLKEDAWWKVTPWAVLKNRDCNLLLSHERVCTNRYGGALVSVLSISLNRNDPQPGASRPRIWESGPLVFVPRVEMPEDELIQICLADLCGVNATLQEPDWLGAFVPPGQPELDVELEELNQEIATMQNKLAALAEKRRTVREPLRLLFDWGSRLEETVRQVLQALGAEVEEPTDPGKEDGWISVKTSSGNHVGVLEVKGTRKKTFDEAGMRQLLDWINRGVELRKAKYKGIFVGASDVESDPAGRQPPFSQNWVTSAELHGIAALTATDLYKAFVKHSRGDLDTDTFWDRLFNTSGVCDIGDLVQED